MEAPRADFSQSLTKRTKTIIFNVIAARETFYALRFIFTGSTTNGAGSPAAF
jgi:hypothetical protein